MLSTRTPLSPPASFAGPPFTLYSPLGDQAPQILDA